MSSATATTNQKPKYQFSIYEMTFFQWVSLYLAWDREPRCYVCGRPLHIGDKWRWFFKQPNNEELWLPVFGCAHHDGELVYAWGMWREVPPAYSL